MCIFPKRSGGGGGGGGLRTRKIPTPAVERDPIILVCEFQYIRDLLASVYSISRPPETCPDSFNIHTYIIYINKTDILWINPFAA